MSPGLTVPAKAKNYRYLRRMTTNLWNPQRNSIANNTLQTNKRWMKLKGCCSQWSWKIILVMRPWNCSMRVNLSRKYNKKRRMGRYWLHLIWLRRFNTQNLKSYSPKKHQYRFINHREEQIRNILKKFNYRDRLKTTRKFWENCKILKLEFTNNLNPN